MWIDCVETIRTFQYVILMFSCVAFVRTTAPLKILYRCSNDGVELVTSSDVSHVAISLGTSSSRTYCRPQNIQLSPCRKDENKFSMSVLYEEESEQSVIGGKTIGFYKLVCSNLPTNVTRNTTVYTAISEPKNEVPETDDRLKSFSLKLKNSKDQIVDENTPLNIGETLQLQMIGTDVEISPIKCDAYPVDNKTSRVTIWKLHTELTDANNCVNEDPAIVETAMWSQITKQEPSIRINIFAFRFLTSAKVAIECSATLCAKGDIDGCKRTCVTLVTRKRRSIRDIVAKDNSKHIGSASVSFAVTENKPLDNSSPGLSVGFMKIATMGVVILACLL